MPTIKLLSLVLMVAFYLFAGISHFRSPKFFLSITPSWVPSPERVNYLVGAIEIILGLCLLFPVTRPIAVMGIIALLIVVFPANIYHFQKALKKKKMVWLTLLRLPLQLVLIYWAYSFI